MKRKLHLFITLFMLIAGVAEMSAYNYTVNYVGRTKTQGAGYTLVSGQNRINANSSTQDLIVTNSNNNNGQLNANNYTSYFTPNPIEGYGVSVTFSNTTTNRSITITYTSLIKTYRMIFDRQMVPGSGYTVNNAYKGNGTNGLKITSADDAELLVFEATSANNLPDVTTDNISTYITARTVTGYSTPSLYVNTAEAELGYSANVTISYTTTADPNDPALTWNDGTFQYSRIYTRQSYNSVLLPEDEVAISLYLGETETVTDTVAYTTSQTVSQYYTNYNVVNNNNVVIGTIRVDYNNNYTFTPASGTFADDDGDGVGTTATYEYIGHHANGFGTGGTYFFKRTHEVACSKVTNVVIPATTVHDGQTYKVTAIQKWGFCYNQTDQMMISNGTSNSCTADYFWGAIDDHSNWYLKSVSFEYPSNVKSIGDYAFMSCVKLKSAVFPSSIEYLGQGIFEMCEALTDMRFETITANDLKAGESEDLIGKVRFNAIRMFTFWLCTSLETLELPDGITMIEGQQAGAALQYMLSLINLRLPNTLESIGPHFLCCAIKLKNLTIPASVKYIDGASFHGCQSLENVYLLGPAAALQLEYTASGSEESSSTFSANETFCADAVENTTFWTTKDYIDSYRNDPVWALIDEDGQAPHYNWLKEIPEEEREFAAGKWATAIFPHAVPDACAAIDKYNDITLYSHQDKVKNGFGANTKVAVMESAEAQDGTDPKTGDPITVYNITFRLLTPADGALLIPADTPVLICPGEKAEHLMCTYEDMEDEAFKARMSVDYKTTITPQGGKFNSTIDMIGRYTGHQLAPWDFYFMYSGETAKFYRVPDQTNAANIKAYRCWWTLTLNGTRVDGQAVNSQGAKFFRDFEDDNATAIQTVDGKNIIVKAGIYDVQGRKLNVSEEELPQGMFIINGKKVLVK